MRFFPNVADWGRVGEGICKPEAVPEKGSQVGCGRAGRAQNTGSPESPAPPWQRQVSDSSERGHICREPKEAAHCLSKVLGYLQISIALPARALKS